MRASKLLKTIFGAFFRYYDSGLLTIRFRSVRRFALAFGLNREFFNNPLGLCLIGSYFR